MATVLGFDSSTQSLSAVILDTDSGQITAEASVNFGNDLPQYEQPHGYDDMGVSGEVHSSPLMWLESLDLLLTRMKSEGVDFSDITAVSGSGQQHGSVYLNSEFEKVLASLDSGQCLVDQVGQCLTRKSSPIWMDSSTSAECDLLSNLVGGENEVCQISGSIPVERFTGPQISKFAASEPAAYESTGIIHLVSSFFASIFAGKNVAIDHGDGAGMNLMNLESGSWDQRLLSATAPDLKNKLPEVAPSFTVAGPISSYFVEKYGFNTECRTVIWSGDNPCSLVGMGAARPGKVVVSLGTSDTLFAAMPEPRTDPQGFGHAFGNPIGGFMSLICFKNGSLAREAVKKQFGLEWSAFEKEALSETPLGNEGLLMLPFYEPEITPRIDTRGPIYSSGIQPTAAQAVRAVLEGQFLNMRLHFGWLGISPERISITGGASENDGIAQVIANVFGVPVDRLDVPGSAAVGAAMRASHATGGSLGELESKFSHPKEGSTIQPEEGAKAVYDVMLPKFEAFLKEQQRGLISA